MYQFAVFICGKCFYEIVCNKLLIQLGNSGQSFHGIQERAVKLKFQNVYLIFNKTLLSVYDFN